MSKTKRITILLVVIFMVSSLNTVMVSASSKNFLPFENAEVGRNSNAYLPTYSPSMDDENEFYQ